MIVGIHKKEAVRFSSPDEGRAWLSGGPRRKLYELLVKNGRSKPFLYETTMVHGRLIGTSRWAARRRVV